MLSRLWWKESRQFWPLWVFLVLSVVGLQAMLSQFAGGRGVWDGHAQWTPLTMALCWTALYALTAGAAAFAGEREMKTLAFLDAIPVPRSTLWNGKAGFAFLSTFGVGLVLGVCAWLATLANPSISVGSLSIVPLFGPVVLEALCWSLFWSSFTRNALVSAICTLATLFVDFVFIRALSVVMSPSGRPFGMAYSVQGALFAVLLSLSCLLGSRWRMTRQLRSGPARPQRPALPIDRARIAEVGAPERLARTRRLVWHAFRSQRTEWRLVFLFLAIGISLFVIENQATDPWFFGCLLATATGLLVGVSMFSREGTEGTNRFLAHHGVPPGTLWNVRQTTGLFKIALTGVAIVASVAAFSAPGGTLDGIHVGYSPDQWPLRSVFVVFIVGLLLHGFAVSQLCGLVLKREITALVVALVFTIVTFVPIGMLVFQGLVPLWGIFVTPVALLLISRLCLNDWMLHGPGTKVAIKPLVLVIAAFGLEAALYIGQRVYEVPDIQLALRLEDYIGFGESQREASLALEGVVQSLKLPKGIDEYVSDGNPNGDPEARVPAPKFAESLYELNQGAIESIRAQASRRDAPLLSVAGLTLASGVPLWIQHLPRLMMILERDAGIQISKGNLETAWLDIEAMLMLGRRMSVAAPVSQMIQAQVLLLRSDRLAMEWASEGRLTKAEVDKALASLRAFPNGGMAVDTVAVEWLASERTLNVLAEDPSFGPKLRPALYSAFTEASWELARARKVFKILAADTLQWAQREPYDRPWTRPQKWPFESFSDLSWPISNRATYLPYESIYNYTLTTPLAGYYPRWGMDGSVTIVDHELLERRALVSVMTIRSWQFARDPRADFAEKSSTGVFRQLAELPNDPFSGRPFGLIRSKGQTAVSIEYASHKAAELMEKFPGIIPKRALRATRSGQWLLYSVGPDGRDDHGLGDDCLFPIPDSPFSGGEPK